MKKFLPFWLLSLVPAAGVWAQGETCGTASPLTVGASCTATNFTMTSNVGNEMAAPACAASNRDGWWTFTTGAGVTSITVSETTNRPIALALYSGCAAANIVACQSIGNAAGSMVVTVTPNTTYYLRVMRTNTGTNAWTGSVCVYVTPPPPANDNCGGAVSLTPGATCTPTAGTTVNATQSMAATACGGFTGNADDDVWYSFTATATSHTVTLGTNSIDAVIQGFSGSCGGLASIGCADNVAGTGTETMTLTGLGIGSVYYVRVYDYDAGAANAGTFTICVTAPPANDGCGGAVSLTVGATCTVTAGSTAGASQSQAGCAGTAEDDVWFSFVATATSQVVTVDGASTFDAVLQVFSGACGSLASLGCIDNTEDDGVEEVTLTGLTVGATYRVRVYDYYGTASPTPTFSICVTVPAPPPANDQCSAVTPVTLVSAVPHIFNGTTAGATTTNDGIYNGDPTVWHAITLTGSCNNVVLSFCGTSPVPGDAWINMATNCPPTAATAVGAYETTSCGDGNLTISFAGLAAGTYYIPVLGYVAGLNTAGPYTLSVTSTDCPPPPANDNVCGAIPLTVGSTVTPAFTAATNVNATNGSQGVGSCSAFGEFANDVWYSAVVPATGNVVVALNPGSVLEDLIAQVFTSSNGTCSGTLTAVACNDDDGEGLRPFVYAGGLPVGSAVFIRISSYDAGTAGQGTFGLAVTDAIHWTGNTSTIPTVPGNWFGNPDNTVYPSATSDVRIFNVPNVLSPVANLNVLDVYMNDGATVNNNGGNLRVNGDWHGASQANPANVVSPADNNFLVLLSNNGTIDGYTNAQRVRLNGTYAIASGTNHLNISKFLQTVSGVLTTNNNLTFLSDATGTAYLNDFNATYTGSVAGNIHMQRYNPLGLQGFRQLGTPVQLPNISGLAGFTPSGTAGFVIPVPTCDPNYVAFNSPYGNWMQLVENATPQYNCHQSLFEVLTSGGMTNGRGYYLDVPGNSTLTYTGAANTGIVSFPLTHANTAVTNGWNMVSNPFPSPLAWELLNVPVGVDAIAKIWQTSGAYLGTWQDLDPLAAGTQAVAIGQAFQVRVTVPGTSVPFLVDNLDRTTAAPTYLFAGGDPMTLNIDVLGGGFADLTKVRFVDGAGPDMDAQFDSPKMLGNANQPMVYSVWNGKDYSTNSFGELTEVYTLPLGVKIAQAGEHTLQFSNVDQFPASALIYLEDTETGAAWQDVRANDTYLFTEGVGNHTDRFVLHFYPPVHQAVVDATCETTGQVLLTEASPSTWDYVLQDAQADTVSQGLLDGSQTIGNLPAGTYTLTLTEPVSGYVAVETVTIQGAVAVSAQAQASVLMAEPGQEIQFTGTGTADTWHWDFGDLNTSSEQNPQHAYNAPGTYEVLLTASNATCSVTSSLAVEVSAGTASVPDGFAAAGMELWNDNSVVYLKFSEIWKGKTIFALFDAQGKKIVQHQFTDANGSQQIDCGPLAAGMYTVELRGNGTHVSRKVLMGR